MRESTKWKRIGSWKIANGSLEQTTKSELKAGLVPKKRVWRRNCEVGDEGVAIIEKEEDWGLRSCEFERSLALSRDASDADCRLFEEDVVQLIIATSRKGGKYKSK